MGKRLNRMNVRSPIYGTHKGNNNCAKYNYLPTNVRKNYTLEGYQSG